MFYQSEFWKQLNETYSALSNLASNATDVKPGIIITGLVGVLLIVLIGSINLLTISSNIPLKDELVSNLFFKLV